MEKNNDPINYDNIDSVRKKLETVRIGVKTHKLLDLDKRLEQLKILRAMFIQLEDKINEASKKDLGQESFMSYFASYSPCLHELDFIIDNMKEWAKPRPVDTPALLAIAKSYVIPEPFGVCLVMGSWNSPFNTLILPVAEAIAAGNCVLAKPSEMSPYSAAVAEIIFNEMDPEVVQTLQGDAEVCIEILKHKLDVIVFTGSPEKGKLVAKAAAEHLTPCILELGGQNPVIIDNDADMMNAAYNLVSSRFLISGQICLAPEYCLVPKLLLPSLINAIKQTVLNFYKGNPKESPDYSRMINDFHTERVIKLIESHGGNLITGGDFDKTKKYIGPTIITFNSLEEATISPISREEIFGPIMYLIPVETIEECIEYINSKDKPLVLYYFGGNKANKEKIIKYTSSGAFVANDTIIHFSNYYLPFGGVGKSGYGACHGRWGFDNLSHLKPIMDKGQQLMKFRYPPFDEKKLKVFKFLFANVTISQAKLLKVGVIFSFLLVALLLKGNQMWNYINPFKR